MAKAQFARVHTYTPKTIGGILAEADRQEGATSHIEAPEPPKWITGSSEAVGLAVTAYMSKPATVRLKNGGTATRKRRSDHRCLTAGVLSWPDSIELITESTGISKLLQFVQLDKWIKKSERWLKEKYGDNLVGICVHNDESHPHLHFFIVGDAQRLHPGMKAELVNDTRMTDNKARMTAHKAGLKSWLNDYHESVSQHFGLERKLDSKPAWRIQDRATRAKLFKIDKQLQDNPNPDILLERNNIWDSEQKTERPEMKF